MTDKKPTLADLIAKTPGAQPLARARAFIKARRAQLLGPDAPPPDPSAAEPLPLDAPDAFAKGFFERLMRKQTPPRGSKPRLVVDNEPPLSPPDDDPEPPKAA